MNKNTNDNLSFKDGNVSYNSLQVEGVDTKDYPDFCDCWIAYGEWTDGTPLTESELEGIQEEYSDLAYELAIDTIY
jgi:hypothetical protein